jgi:hypothetical protein
MPKKGKLRKKNNKKKVIKKEEKEEKKKKDPLSELSELVKGLMTRNLGGQSHGFSQPTKDDRDANMVKEMKIRNEELQKKIKTDEALHAQSIKEADIKNLESNAALQAQIEISKEKLKLKQEMLEQKKKAAALKEQKRDSKARDENVRLGAEVEQKKKYNGLVENADEQEELKQKQMYRRRYIQQNGIKLGENEEQKEKNDLETESYNLKKQNEAIRYRNAALKIEQTPIIQTIADNQDLKENTDIEKQKHEALVKNTIARLSSQNGETVHVAPGIQNLANKANEVKAIQEDTTYRNEKEKKVNANTKAHLKTQSESIMHIKPQNIKNAKRQLKLEMLENDTLFEDQKHDALLANQKAHLQTDVPTSFQIPEKITEEAQQRVELANITHDTAIQNAQVEARKDFEVNKAKQKTTRYLEGHDLINGLKHHIIENAQMHYDYFKRGFKNFDYKKWAINYERAKERIERNEAIKERNEFETDAEKREFMKEYIHSKKLIDSYQTKLSEWKRRFDIFHHPEI